ncbi:MAG TPA: MarR family winged helix-turn-helix transcriptional regulator [Candidatus Cybelea sp.]
MLEDPRNCACLGLRAATRRMTRRYDEALAPSGLTSSQFSMLTALSAKPSWGVAELAGQLDMDVSTATRSLRPLVTAGYVTMRAGVADARRREVRISAKGSRAFERARSLWRTAQKDTVKALGERRVTDLLAMLSEVV